MGLLLVEKIHDFSGHMMSCLKCSKDQDMRKLESALDKSSPPITYWTGNWMYVEWFNPVWNCPTQLQNGWVELLYILVQWMSCKTVLFCNGQATMNSLRWENKTSKSIYPHHIMYFLCQSCFHRTLILRVSFSHAFRMQDEVETE